MNHLNVIDQIQHIHDLQNRSCRASNSLAHKTAVQKFINDAIKTIDTNIATVFGAGNCNDIDLKFLTSSFEKVFLVDIDLDALTLAKSRLPQELSNKVALVHKDITGLYNSPLMKQLHEACLDNNHDLICDILDKILLCIPDLPQPFMEHGQSDLSISICVPSQFFAPIIFNWLPTFEENQLADINSKALSISWALSDRYGEFLAQNTCSNGCLIIASEYFEWDFSKNPPAGIAKVIPSPLDLVVMPMFELVNYILKNEQYRIAGSEPSSLFNFFHPHPEAVTRFWEWEFSAIKRYFVIGHLFQRNAVFYLILYSFPVIRSKTHYLILLLLRLFLLLLKVLLSMQYLLMVHGKMIPYSQPAARWPGYRRTVQGVFGFSKMDYGDYSLLSYILVW